MSNQPIEEKWKEELSYLCDSWDYNYDRLESFIENLLEQERQRMSDEIQRIEERLSDSERWPIGERKRMQNTIKKVLSIINK